MDIHKSNTASDSKDLWQTPPGVFHNLDDEFNFDLDVCASNENKLCSHYFTEEKSALDFEWDFCHNTSAFINPPYSLTEVFLRRSAEQAKRHNIIVVALVNANTDTKWFSDAVSSANEIRLITGRLAFIKPGGTKGKGNSKGQCIIVWRGNCKTPCQITMVDRKNLSY